LGKHQREYAIDGMKLFGRCKMYGNCVCGDCANKPVNRKDTVKITYRDGSVHEMSAPAQVEAVPAEGTSYARTTPPPERTMAGTKIIGKRTPEQLARRKRCPDCNVLLRSDHVCKVRGAQNGPVTTKLPGGEPVRELPKARRLCCATLSGDDHSDHCPSIGFNAETFHAAPVAPEDDKPAESQKMVFMSDEFQEFTGLPTNEETNMAEVAEQDVRTTTDELLATLPDAPPQEETGGSIEISVPMEVVWETQATTVGIATLSKLSPKARLRVAQYLMVYATESDNA